ncbi:MAG TPA: chemotaxis protein CheD [Burkholderiaceae bacterium]|nr:chemotaxis protein CheD [Burkholderiaceae bacterium]
MSAVAVATRVLHPGDVACADAGERLETLLGSCVAVILTDPRRTVGAMCHIVHADDAPRAAPRAGARGRAGPRTRDRRSAHHAEPAIDAMFAQLRARAIEPRLCDAYVFGGGNMFPGLMRGPAQVGDRNVDAVLRRLGAEGVRIVRHDVGGAAYRRLGWTVGPDEPEVVAVPV